jgi:sugar/nucleoside kinase (ribokinase family)
VEECSRIFETSPNDRAVLGVIWSAHFQDICAAFGMETAFIKMLTEPAIDLMPGGDAMNEAVIMSRLGLHVGLIGKIGDDSLGHMVLEKAEKSGVDIDNVKISGSTGTTTSVVLINEKGDRNFIFCKGSNSVFSMEDIDLSMIGRSKIISVGSLFELPMLDRGGIETIFKKAKEKKVTTAADVTHDVYGLGLEGIKGVLTYTDIFLPSYVEAVYLTKREDPEKAAEMLLNCGVKIVVIKLGPKGCYIKTGEESLYINTYDVKRVDTTGAGDNFVAGFLTGTLKGWDLKKCGMFANVVGSICVGEVGATSSVQSMEQVLKFMRENKLSY